MSEILDGGGRGHARSLAPPPRTLPPTLVIQALFGTVLGQFGWAFLAFGMVFVWAFDAGGAIAEFASFQGEIGTTTGVVTGSRETNTSVNEVRVHATMYDFQLPDGRTFSGTSYATGRSLQAGSDVTIEYATADPTRSRISGMRTSIGGGMVVLVFLFPIIGLGMAIADLMRRTRALRLLRHGTMTSGVFETMRATSTRINNQPVMELTFLFEDEYGNEHRATAKSHRTERLQDEPRELIVYDPADPGAASVLDELPCQPRVGADGNFEATRGTLPSALYLLLPGLSLLTLVRYWASLM